MISVPHNRIHRDSAPIDQPKGTYTYLLNGVIKSLDGKTSRVASEPGFELILPYSRNEQLLGSRYISNNKAVVFYKLEDSSEIGILDDKGNYSVFINDPCLGFKNRIDSIYRLRKGCEDVIYFTEKDNPVRFVNLSKTYNEDVCEKLKLQRDFSIPCFHQVRVSPFGGDLKEGSYNAVIRYLDEDLNPTEFMMDSMVVYVEPDTNSSIEIRVSDLDSRFPYYQIALVAATSGTGIANNIYLSEEIPISQTFWTFSSIEDTLPLTIEEIRARAPAIATAEHIDHVDNRMLLANTTSYKYDVCGLQKAASKIATTYIIDEVEENSNLVIPTYMPDEIYSLGICYVFDSGYVTDEYHIPGRPLNKNPLDCSGLPAIGTGQVYDKCLKVNINGTVTWYPGVRVDYILRYKVNGESKIYYGQVGMDQGQQSAEDIVECSNQEITEVSLEVADYLWAGITSITYTIENTGTVIGGLPNIPQSLSGWDNTIYSYTGRKLEDTRLFIPDDQYNAILLQLFKQFYGVDPTGASDPRYNTTDFLNYIKEEVKANRVSLPYRWELYNTSFKLGETEGLMGYYECKNTTYQNNASSCSDDQWGQDACNQDLTGTPVRHHRMPSRTLEPIKKETKLRKIGIKFHNIEYPDSRIVGHFFVAAKRTEANKTVVDSAIIGNVQTCTNGANERLQAFGWLKAQNQLGNTYNYSITPKSLFKNEKVTGSHQILQNALSTGENITAQEFTGTENNANADYKNDLRLAVRIYDVQEYNASEQHTIVTDQTFELAPFDVNPEDEEFLTNISSSNRILINKIVTQDGLPGLGGSSPTLTELHYGLIKVQKEVYCNMDNLVYRSISRCVLTLEDQQVSFEGDVFISKLDWANAIFRDHDREKVGPIIGAVLAVAASITALVAGAPQLAKFIASQFAVGATAGAIAQFHEDTNNERFNCILESSYGLDGPLDEENGAFDGAIVYAAEVIEGIWMDSEINMNLRTETEDQCGYYYNKSFSGIEYFKNKLVYYDEDVEKYDVTAIPCAEVYNYNLDYSRIRCEKIYSNIPFIFDCCSDCIEVFKNRVWYSEQSFQEEVVDHYRNIKPNNYRDIEGEHGEITNLTRVGNTIKIHTEESLWHLPQNIQERVTGDVTSFIGTGDYFSIPPRKVGDSDLGSKGCIDKWATLKTPYGLFFVSRREAGIYLQTPDGTLEELSSEKYGMSSFFKRHIPAVLEQQYSDPGDPYTQEVVFHAVYDSRLKRIILTKRDWEAYEGVVYDSDGFAGTDNPWYKRRGPVELGDPECFCDKGWTLSFSFVSMGWVGFHSYTPDIYIPMKEVVLAPNDEGIWKFNKEGLSANYFGEAYPVTIEYIANHQPVVNSSYHDVEIQAEFFKWTDSGYVKTIDEVFNKAWFYNSRQSTGEIELINNINSIPEKLKTKRTSAFIERAEETWRINSIRDIVVTHSVPMFTKKCIDYRLTDMLINQDALDVNKDWRKTAYFKDNFLYVRLILDRFDDVQMVLNFSIESEVPSIR